MAMATTRRYPVADLANFPDDGNRYELIRGALVVSPTPSVHHQIVVSRLARALATYLAPLGLGGEQWERARSRPFAHRTGRRL